MEAPLIQPDDYTVPEHGYIGAIPVRNIWLLMLYASDLFRIKGMDGNGIEDMPDDLPDLVGEILAHAVEQRQRRRLSLGYRTRTAALNRVRGRIDVLKTERHQLLSRGLVACRFDELTINTPRNRFVRAALELISRIAARPDVVRRCRRLANDMKMMGVSGTPPTLREISTDRFGRHDVEDQEMVAAAKLAFELAIPTENAGSQKMPLSDRDERWVRKLFERAVGGFFKVVLPPTDWHVRTGGTLAWPTSASTDGISRILPGMRTDIVLDDKVGQRRIVIDTKFNTIVTNGWYREESLRSGYLYQMYAYLRSQEGSGDGYSDDAEGLLLHPAVGTTFDESVIIQGHKIRFMTVDLTANSSAIRAELLRVTPRSECHGLSGKDKIKDDAGQNSGVEWT
ncbi:5-methylcytosine-specific restriction enzyme subunit McrC [Loktanella salsilacus]|uniref:5-methylcytosine-specific restriction enzyme subunit McrC n=1 Tax=Loktanella salsilacus TaxID=195913 RepID=A0A1I4HQB7_9RHOB|nr:5-methylcytosine-specific restriction endonuclease system specificity protein McrC [Loktanella salsilacus]SFL43953.1 5-methylcytosine-specific restriction enzyme subunit McrC [Loktanella salsilacus]